MNYITQQEQFIGEISLNLNTKCGEDELLKHFIEEFEPSILRGLLGVEFYNELQFELNGSLTGDWETLVNGGDFTHCGKLHHFKGLKYITARYIYWHYLRNNQSTTGKHNEVIPEVDAGISVGYHQKATTQWNKAFDESLVLKKFLDSSELEGYKFMKYEGGRLLEW